MAKNRLRMDDWSPQPGRFKPGDRVVVVDGTFVGSEGTVLGEDDVRARGLFNPPPGVADKLLWVMLTVFGREAPVQMQTSQVMRADEEQP